jgi:hypothetical protein
VETDQLSAVVAASTAPLISLTDLAATAMANIALSTTQVVGLSKRITKGEVGKEDRNLQESRKTDRMS